MTSLEAHHLFDNKPAPRLLQPSLIKHGRLISTVKNNSLNHEWRDAADTHLGKAGRPTLEQTLKIWLLRDIRKGVPTCSFSTDATADATSPLLSAYQIIVTHSARTYKHMMLAAIAIVVITITIITNISSMLEVTCFAFISSTSAESPVWAAWTCGSS